MKNVLFLLCIDMMFNSFFYADRMKMHGRKIERYHGNEVAVVMNLMKQVQSLISSFTLTWSTRPQ